MVWGMEGFKQILPLMGVMAKSSQSCSWFLSDEWHRWHRRRPASFLRPEVNASVPWCWEVAKRP